MEEIEKENESKVPLTKLEKKKLNRQKKWEEEKRERKAEKLARQKDRLKRLKLKLKKGMSKKKQDIRDEVEDEVGKYVDVVKFGETSYEPPKFKKLPQKPDKNEVRKFYNINIRKFRLSDFLKFLNV